MGNIDIIYFRRQSEGKISPYSVHVPDVDKWEWLHTTPEILLVYHTLSEFEGRGNMAGEGFVITGKQRDSDSYFTHNASTFLTIVHAIPKECVVDFNIGLTKSPLFYIGDYGCLEDREAEVEKILAKFPSHLETAIRNLLHLEYVHRGYFTAIPSIKRTIPKEDDSIRYMSCGCRVNGHTLLKREGCTFSHTHLSGNEWIISGVWTLRGLRCLLVWEEMSKVNSVEREDFLEFLASENGDSYRLLISKLKNRGVVFDY